MALAMARPWQDPITGIWYLRKRVPKDLVGRIGSSIFKRSLATKDPAEARRRYPAILAELEARWANLRAGPRSLTEREAHELAAPLFENWLAAYRDNPSEQYLWHPELYGGLWTGSPEPEVEPEPGVPSELPINNVFLRSMRQLCFQHAESGLEMHGLTIDDESRLRLAKAVGTAFQRASVILERESRGEVESQPASRSGGTSSGAMPLFGSGGPSADSSGGIGSRQGKAEPLSLTGLLEGWWQEAKAAGRKPSTYESYRNTTKGFVAFLKHDDATRVSADDVVAFKDYRLSTPSAKTGKIPSAKTVKDSDLSALKTLFGWAVVNRKLLENPAAGLTIKLGKPRRMRSKGFTDAEAVAILTAAQSYRDGNERACTAAAKRWVPWLCAFTGARVGEIGQLRKQDVRQEGDVWVIHITPDAGTQKTNEARDVVLHPQLVELGFPAFVTSCADGHLFLTPAKTGDVLGPLQGLKNRLAEFAREIVPDPNVAPNHGWRHRFKTVGMEAGIAPRILDAIQGQATRSVADSYGEVTLKTMAAAVLQLPSVAIDVLS